MSHVRVALCQMQSGEDVEENVRVAEELLDGAADGGADLAALPEVFSYHGAPRLPRAQPPHVGPGRLSPRARR